MQVGIGPYLEVAFYHKASKTILVTDFIVKVPPLPLAITPEDKLLDAAKPNPFSPISPIPENSEEARLKGWKRMIL